jgi:hypothetical protein
LIDEQALLHIMKQCQADFGRRNPSVGIFSETMRACLRILRDKPPTYGKDAFRNDLRLKALNMLNENILELSKVDLQTYSELPGILMDSIEADKLLAYSEYTRAENIDCLELALRVLASPPYSSRRGGPLRSVVDRLIPLAVGLVGSTQAVQALTTLPEPVQHQDILSNTPVYAGDGGRAPATALLPLITRITTLQQEAGESTLLEAIAPRAWHAIESLPSAMLAQVRDRRLYQQFLTGMVAELLAILDLAWASQTPPLETTLAMAAGAQLQLLANLPPGTEKLRLSILQRLEAGLGAEVRRS